MFSVGFLRVAGFMVVRVSGVSMMIGEWGGGLVQVGYREGNRVDVARRVPRRMG